MRTKDWLIGLHAVVMLVPSPAKSDDLAPMARSIEQRIAGRTFPSVFQAWARADNLPHEDKLTTVARHDLVFHAPEYFGLRWDRSPRGLGTVVVPESIIAALRQRRMLLEKNPNIILLAEIRYRDASRRFLPEGHKWWKRDENGKLKAGWREGRYLKLDFHNPEYQQHVARRAGAVVATGAVDGVMLDWWTDDEVHLELIKKVRQAVGEEALILANANDRKTPQTAPFINGYFMECYRSKTPGHWKTIAETLAWAEKNLRRPRVNCLETWYHRSPNDLHLMRSVTTLSLTLSDGYCLFSDPDPLPTSDHLHNWYPFWDNRLGKPLRPGVQRSDGARIREFAGGTAVYNPMGNPAVTISFANARTSAATGKLAREQTVPEADGDIFLSVPPEQ